MTLVLGHVHALDVVYVHGGRSALTFQGLWHLFWATFIRWMLCIFVGEKCTDLLGFLALALGHVHMSYVVYVHGGWSALTLSDGPNVGDKCG